MCLISVGLKENEKITVEITEFSNADDWINGDVSLSVGKFSGSYRAYFMQRDFIVFREQLSTLYNSLNGSAKFETMEGQLEINITGNGRGAIDVNGCAVDQAGCGNKLFFSFSLDQTYAPQIIHDFDKLIEKFQARMA